MAGGFSHRLAGKTFIVRPAPGGLSGTTEECYLVWFSEMELYSAHCRAGVSYAPPPGLESERSFAPWKAEGGGCPHMDPRRLENIRYDLD
jgi:hypothetical protein